MQQTMNEVLEVVKIANGAETFTTQQLFQLCTLAASIGKIVQKKHMR